jgi:hypothetical protein
MLDGLRLRLLGVLLVLVLRVGVGLAGGGRRP